MELGHWDFTALFLLVKKKKKKIEEEKKEQEEMGLWDPNDQCFDSASHLKGQNLVTKLGCVRSLPLKLDLPFFAESLVSVDRISICRVVG